MFETYITQITELQWSNDHVHMEKKGTPSHLSSNGKKESIFDNISKDKNIHTQQKVNMRNVLVWAGMIKGAETL